LYGKLVDRRALFDDGGRFDLYEDCSTEQLGFSILSMFIYNIEAQTVLGVASVDEP